MAERRMFHVKVVESDAFLSLPVPAQVLYFHLGMQADEDGFVNNPKRITRLLGVGDRALTVLLRERFLLDCGAGIVVIKHWRMANSLKNDRAKALRYPDAAARLYVKENKAYTDHPEEGAMTLLEYKATCLKKKGGEQNGSSEGENAGFQNGIQNGIQNRRGRGIQNGIPAEQSRTEQSRTEKNQTEHNGTKPSVAEPQSAAFGSARLGTAAFKAAASGERQREALVAGPLAKVSDLFGGLQSEAERCGTRMGDFTAEERSDAARLAEGVLDDDDLSEADEAVEAARRLQALHGTLGRGAVLLTDEQMDDLLKRMGLECFDYYVSKLASFLLDHGGKAKNHYRTLLKWWQEDSRLEK